MDEIAFRAAVYGRISDDREADELGVKRQIEAGCELVSQRGGSIVMQRSDNDITALTGAARPGYQDVMRAAAAGEITHIVVFHTSRLWRNRRERADGIELLRKAGVSVVAVRGPDLDMSTAYGRGMAGLIGEFDTMESEVKSERIRLKVEELVAAGKHTNGGPRPFGYRRIYAGEGPRRKILRDEIDQEEAAIVADCVKRALSGKPLRSILRDLNARGIRTTLGGPWSQQGLRYMLISGRIAGLKEHHGVVTGPAVWPAIVTREEHEQLRALLTTPGRGPAGGVTARKYYLTGWVRCTCGVAMRAGPFGDSGKTRYACRPKVEGGCGARVVNLDDVERVVGAYVVERLSDPATLRELAAREQTADAESRALTDKITADERRLARLEAAMSDEDQDDEDLPEVISATKAVRRRIKKHREQLATLAGVPPELWDDIAHVVERWPVAGMDRKRALMSLVVSKVVIKPATQRGRFDPRRVDIVPPERRNQK